MYFDEIELAEHSPFFKAILSQKIPIIEEFVKFNVDLEKRNALG